MTSAQTDVSTDHQDGARKPKSVVVIGAGLSGLMAARDLTDLGFDVMVFEQGRAPGGRLLTKRSGSATFDVGAQFFTTRSESFTSEVAGWEQAGLVSKWCNGFETEDGHPRYMAHQGMAQLAKALAEPLNVQTKSQVSSVVPLGDRWAVTFNIPELAPVEADAVVLSCPAPLALQVLHNGGAVLDTAARAAAESLKYHRVIACQVLTDSAPDLGPSGAWQNPTDSTFSFVANNQVKGISASPALTFHLSHEASERLWATKDKKLQAELADNFKAILGSSEVTGFSVKRWHHAGPVAPLADRSLVVATSPGPAVLCGDAYGGPKVEGAYLSGRAAAIQTKQLFDRP